MLIRIIIFWVTIISGTTLIGQECGVTMLDQSLWISEYLENLSDLKNKSFVKSDHQVPIVLHLVARDNGGSRAKVSTALEVLCELNDLYEHTGLSFYLPDDGIRFVDHTGIFTNSDFTINKLVMSGETLDSAINVFVVNSIGSSNVVGYFDVDDDWIVIKKSGFVSGNKSLAHEIGHFFSLLHPHFGWDARAYDTNIDGNRNLEFASDGITEAEKMDGSNCATSGDMLCDTPPDYNFGLGWQKSCNYLGSAMDANGTLVDPDESLIMSYYNDSCRQKFTEEQIALMMQNLSSPSREHIYNVTHPTINYLQEPTNLISPIESTTTANNSIVFNWSKVDQALSYYIEVDRSPTFNLDPKGFITIENTISISQSWVPGLDYYWRVYAWNATDFCLSSSETKTFKVDVMSDVDNINHDFRIRIYANENKLQITHNLARSEEAALKIYDLSGGLIFSKNINLSFGKSQQIVNLPYFPTGLYLIVLSTAQPFTTLVHLP